MCSRISRFVFTALLLLCSRAHAQQHDSVLRTVDTAVVQKPRYWSVNGQNALMLNQAYFSNWLGGGANNAGWLGNLNYTFTYQRGPRILENLLIVGYGHSHTEGLGRRKTQDVLNLGTNYGRNIGKAWYISAGASLLTQLMPGYQDGNNPDTTRISNFMAPGYVNTGLGFTYRPHERFTLTLRPANARFTFVTDPDLQKAGMFGLKNAGDAFVFQFGFLGTAVWERELMKNVHLKNSGSVFSNYLDNPGNLVLGYSGLLNLKVNKYISTNIALDLFYDHNQVARLQMKQALGVGFAYLFDNGVKFETKKEHRDWLKP